MVKPQRPTIFTTRMSSKRVWNLSTNYLEASHNDQKNKRSIIFWLNKAVALPKGALCSLWSANWFLKYYLREFHIKPKHLHSKRSTPFFCFVLQKAHYLSLYPFFTLHALPNNENNKDERAIPENFRRNKMFISPYNKKKLRGLSPRANYTDRAAVAGQS